MVLGAAPSQRISTFMFDYCDFATAVRSQREGRIATMEQSSVHEKGFGWSGVAFIMVSHDVQALDYATHILHMQKKNSFYGTKEEYMNSDKWKLFKNAEENRIGGDKK